MHLSARGAQQIAGFEGWRPQPYDDSAGNATIGYGHLLHTGNVTALDETRNYASELRLAGASTPGRLTIAQGVELLQRDCASVAADVANAVRVRLGIIPARAQVRFDCLCSLAYNIGAGAFNGSTLLRLINAKGAPRDWTTLGPYWLEWSHAGGAYSPGLHARRLREFQSFAAGAWPAA